MGMSDCVECWNAPCTCGHDYKDWPLEKLENFASMINKVIESKKPSYKMSNYKMSVGEFMIQDDEGRGLFARHMLVNTLKNGSISISPEIAAYLEENKNLPEEIEAYLKRNNY